ncbi:Similar to Cytochrome c oxidase subunit 4, mitochondrial; acc. no. P06809 [Pyronema omphalodes CBS 100304]|uniref:Cytochrome c oxidase subunit 4, mitochondrial n=1 Tax=Pyronema omphalodes (strain CBS 100304) TaxID=1076935 RepID=U4LH91_PYROM|nr:Similar to Cytochrome c oxidase subunit 4, mitochondrial; acc. no. P06809 [Pyronema omphalodes CBS 100304]
MFAPRLLARTVARRAVVAPRAFSTALPRLSSAPAKIKTFHEIRTEADLIGPGAKPGTVPSDIDQATGLERFEILGKMEGIDVFDMKPLDASRKGTMEDPIVVPSFGEERYLGCTGFPVDSHTVIWLTTSKDRPVERCPECGSVYKMDYVGPEESHDHHHDHHHQPQVDVPTMADFVKPQYW